MGQASWVKIKKWFKFLRNLEFTKIHNSCKLKESFKDLHRIDMETTRAANLSFKKSIKGSSTILL